MKYYFSLLPSDLITSLKGYIPYETNFILLFSPSKIRDLLFDHEKNDSKEWAEGLWEYALRNKYIYLCKFLAKKVIKKSLNVCCQAINYGCLEIVEWVIENGYPVGEDTIYKVVTSLSKWSHSERIKMLEILRSKGCPLDEIACKKAAAEGLLEVLKWLRENGCSWDEGTCYSAARNGNLEVLEWARANGCPCDDEQIYIIAKDGMSKQRGYPASLRPQYESILLWLKEQNSVQYEEYEK